jgi:hypothetical protein
MGGACAYTVELAAQKGRISANVGVPTGVIEAMRRERPGQASEGGPAAAGFQSDTKDSAPARLVYPARDRKSTR